MKRRGIQTFFIIGISLLIPIFQAYFHYCNLVEADFPSFNLNFESPDQEILPIIRQNESKIFQSSSSSSVSLAEIILVEKLSHLLFNLCFLDQNPFILRCWE